MSGKSTESPDVDAKESNLKIAKKTVSEIISYFVTKLDGIKTSEMLSMTLLSIQAQKVNEDFREFLKKSNIEEEETEEGVIIYKIPLDFVARFDEFKKQRVASSLACRETPRALLVALVSAYDAYLGDLYKTLIYLQPGLLNASQKQLTFQELLEFEALDDAREYLIEKEVESLVRESHASQFTILRKKFNINLKNDLDSWSTFIEITERRNLFVHTDGIVSSQYLKTCKLHGVNVDNLNTGEELHLNPEYFKASFECLFEIGVKLGHVLWRKVSPESIKEADKELNKVCFELLKQEEFKLAENILNFAFNLKKHSDAAMRRIFLVNLVIARKSSGNLDGAINLLESEDWSDCSQTFKLARFVLLERYDEAENMMQQIGSKNEELGKSEYETWPLFKDFRKTEQFKKVFKEIFGKEFEISEVDKSNDKMGIDIGESL